MYRAAHAALVILHCNQGHIQKSYGGGGGLMRGFRILFHKPDFFTPPPLPPGNNRPKISHVFANFLYFYPYPLFSPILPLFGPIFLLFCIQVRGRLKNAEIPTYNLCQVLQNGFVNLFSSDKTFFFL